MVLKHAVIGLSLAFGVASVSQASYITGFESTDDAGYVAGSPLNGVDGWVQLQGTNDGATVVASPIRAGTQAARFSKAPTTATSRAALTFDALTGNNVVLDFYMAFERTAGTTSGISNYVLFGAAADMVAGTGTPENAAVMVGFTRVSSADQLVYRAGGSYVGLGSPVSNEYYHFVINVDLTANTYDLQVTGSNINATVQDIAFRDNNDVDEISGLLTMALSNDARFYVDDLSIVPEPGSMTLLGIGVLLLLTRGGRD